MMRRDLPERLQRYAAEIVGLHTKGEGDGRNPHVLSEDELHKLMNSLEDGTVLSVRFLEGGVNGE